MIRFFKKKENVKPIAYKNEKEKHMNDVRFKHQLIMFMGTLSRYSRGHYIHDEIKDSYKVTNLLYYACIDLINIYLNDNDVTIELVSYKYNEKGICCMKYEDFSKDFKCFMGHIGEFHYKIERIIEKEKHDRELKRYNISVKIGYQKYLTLQKRKIYILKQNLISLEKGVNTVCIKTIKDDIMYYYKNNTTMNKEFDRLMIKLGSLEKSDLVEIQSNHIMNINDRDGNFWLGFNEKEEIC
jgi:hypothetical protein